MTITVHSTDAAVLEELGSRLRHRRIRSDLTQRELAREAGVSVDTVRRLESGNPIATDNLVRALRALELLEAFGAAIPEPQPSPLERLERQGAERQRVRHPSRPATGLAGAWSWGDEAPASSRG